MQSQTTQKAKPQKSIEAATMGGSALKRYQNVIVGKQGLLSLVYFEFCMFLSPIPGALGILLRSLFWPKLFGSCGKKVAFASNITLRYPNRIKLGNRVVISEGCILDGRGEAETTISLKDDIILSNHVSIKSKNGKITIGDFSSFGAFTVINSTNDCPLSIGSHVMTGPHCYIASGSSYNIEDLETPMWQQGIKIDDGTIIETNVWLGANVSILGGSKLSSGSIAAAGTVVTKNFDNNAIIGGVPGKVIKYRTNSVK